MVDIYVDKTSNVGLPKGRDKKEKKKTTTNILQVIR